MDELAGPAPGAPGPDTQSYAVMPPGRRKPRPARFWYWPAVLVILAGLAWPLLGTRADDVRIRSFPRVALPAGGRVALPHGGTYVVYWEGEGASEGNVPAFTVRVRPVTPALTADLQTDSSGATYASGATEGAAVLYLKLSGPGTVFLSGPGAPDIPGGSALAVGSSLPSFLVTIMPGPGLMLLGIGGIVLVATLRSRGAIKRVRYRALLP